MVFGRALVERFALCIGPFSVLSCLSVLSVLSATLVYCGQMVGRIKQTVAQQVHSDSHYKKLLNTILLLQGSCSWLIFVYGTSVNLQVFTCPFNYTATREPYKARSDTMA